MEVESRKSVVADYFIPRSELISEGNISVASRGSRYEANTIEGMRSYVYGRFRAAFRIDGKNLMRAHEGKERLKDAVKVMVQAGQHTLVELLRLEYLQTKYKFPENYQLLVERIEEHLRVAFKKFDVDKEGFKMFNKSITRGVASAYCALDVAYTLFPKYGIIMTPPKLDSEGIDIIAQKEVYFKDGKVFVSSFYIQIKTVGPEKGYGFSIRAGNFNSKGVAAMKPITRHIEGRQSNILRHYDSSTASIEVSQNRQSGAIGFYREQIGEICHEVTPVLLLICPERYCNVDYQSLLDQEFQANEKYNHDPDNVWIHRLTGIEI